MPIYPQDVKMLLTGTKVNLDGRGIFDKQVVEEIVPKISENTVAEELCLQWNNIGDRGAMALAKLTKPIVLVLSYNDIGKEGFRALLANKNIFFFFDHNFYTPNAEEERIMAQRYRERYPAVFAQSDRVSFFKERNTVSPKDGATSWYKPAVIGAVVGLGVVAAVSGLVKMHPR